MEVITDDYQAFIVSIGFFLVVFGIIFTRFFRSRMVTFYSFSLIITAWVTITTIVFIEDALPPGGTTYYGIPADQFLSIVIVVLVTLLTYLFRVRVSVPLKQVISQTNKMAEGYLKSDFVDKVSGTGEASALMYSNRKLSNRFRSVVETIATSSESLAKSAEELASSSEEVAATTEEVTGTIQTIAEGAAEQVRRLEEVSKILSNMTNVIEESIRQIGITSRITLDLAEQTNLVSLNAAIEAAKAGSEGEGFHVVADHVRQLSVESKSASNRVTAITTDISNKMRESVFQIISAVDKIANVAENTAASSEEAAAAAEEQAASLQEITRQAQTLAVLSDQSERNIAELQI